MNWILFTVTVLFGTPILALAETNSGFGYELSTYALESMHESLQSVTAKIDQFIESQSKLEHHVNHLIVSHSKLEQQVNRSLENQSKLEKQVNQLIRSQSKLENQVIDHKTATVAKIEQLKVVIVGESKCPENGSNGTYQLKVPHSSPFEVYCEDGWIMIHRRFNGSLDFDRPWVPYREGFGDLLGEHWLGLQKMHKITRSGFYELLIVLKSFAGVVKTATYEGFKIGSETEQYQLNLAKFVGGDAGDGFGDYHNKMKFSTSDRNNDKGDPSQEPCALGLKSGWWFNACNWANLNGLYEEGKTIDTMSWFYFNWSHDCLKEARMMIRAKTTKTIN